MPTLNTFGSARGFGRAGAARPNQVTGLTATDFGTSRAFNNGRIDLAWTAPGNNGATITGYLIERSTNGSTYSTLVANTGNTNVSYSDTVLTSAQQYWYRVSAINAAGTGDASTAANATATTVPQAPTIGTATAGSAQATITFTANATGGKSITTFTSTASPAAGSGSAASSPITHTGLTNGTAYTFTVTATNANGTSLASAASNSVTPALNVFAGVATNTSSAGLYSTNGTTWSATTLPAAGDWRTLSFGNDVFVSAMGNTTQGATSTDGLTWTSRTLSTSANWEAGAFGAGIHVITAFGTSTYATSTNGITWTTRSFGVSGNWLQVAFGAGLFVAVRVLTASPFNAQPWTSTDGISWTQRSFANANIQSSEALKFANNAFVMTTNGNPGGYSTNGITWVDLVMPANDPWKALAFGNSTWVSVVQGKQRTGTSADGLNWTNQGDIAPSIQQWRTMAFGVGLFAMVGTGSTSAAASTTNGITWTARTLPASAFYYRLNFSTPG